MDSLTGYDSLGNMGRIAMERVVVDYTGAMREQFRFPRSNRKRIKKKWRKRPGNWRRVTDRAWYIPDTGMWMMPVEMYGELRRIDGEANKFR